MVRFQNSKPVKHCLKGRGVRGGSSDVPTPSSDFIAFLVGGPTPVVTLCMYVFVLADFCHDLVSRLGPEILASNPINFLPAHVWSYEAVHSTQYNCTVHFVLCTVVQSFSSEQEIYSHMFHMATSWSEDLVSCQFLSDLHTSNILNVNICKQK